MSKKGSNYNKIVSYPKTPAFFALGVFVFILLLILMGSVRWISIGGMEWYKLLLLVSTSFLMIFMFVRIMFAYKTVTFQGNLVIEKYPLRLGAEVELDLLKYLLFWEEKKKIVNKKEFDILVIQTKLGQPIIISNREMTNYKTVLNLMKTRFKNFHKSKVK